MITSNPKHIAVLGAGISGLVAAYHLTQKKHRVTVIETQPRVGGRVITIRSFFDETLIAQAGPSRFPGDFKRVINYTNRFGLELEPYYPQSGTVVAYLKGKRISEYQPSAEEFWGYTSIVNRYPTQIERVSLKVGLKLRSLARTILGRKKWITYGIKGGTDLLTDAIKNAADAKYLMNCTVKSIEQNKNSIKINYETNDQKKALNADFAVCALPLLRLKDIRFTPKISNKKLTLIKEIPFSSAIRIFIQMKRAYWQDQGHNGFAVTDTLGEIWDPHFYKSDGPTILVCYAIDELADRLGKMNEEERVDYAITELEHIFPGAKKYFEKGISFCWREQPWIQGGWPYVRHGFSRRVRTFRIPEDRLYFVGDYAAVPKWLNMMEGAIESGEYAANQINLI